MFTKRGGRGACCASSSARSKLFVCASQIVAAVNQVDDAPVDRLAAARVDQARAFFDDVQRDRFPIVTVGASVDRREQAIPGFTDERVASDHRGHPDLVYAVLAGHERGLVLPIAIRRPFER